MALDPRDAIWNETHDLLYNIGYLEEINRVLLARWTWLDSITKIAVAIASAGSALAGLVFWKNTDYTFLWPLFTSASALLAIVSKQLNVVDQVQHYAADAAEMTALAIDIGSLIVRMKINTEFSVSDFEAELLAFRERYRHEIRKFRHDLLLTERLRRRAQSRLNLTKAMARQPENHHEQR
jgi:hypothetical protein